jgi:hypothetical protein
VDFDIRLRLLTPSGGKGRILLTQTITITGAESASPTIEFTVSRRVSGALETPMLLGIEYRAGETGWQSPRNNLVIVDSDGADSLDGTQTVTFSGQGIIGWLMQRMPMWWKPGDKGTERDYTNVTAGALMRELILHHQSNHGWAPNLTIDFDGSKDSAGNGWASRTTQKYNLFVTSLANVLSGLSEQGYAEWWAEGWKLRLVNAGTGTDRGSSVVLGGHGFARAPGRTKFDPVSALIVQYEQGWTHFENTGQDDRFGRVFKIMSQSGVKDRDTAAKNAQPALTAGRSLERELSFEWTPRTGLPMPWASFNIGDIVTARTASGREKLRVVGLVVTKAEGVISATAVVGSRMLTHAAKVARRTGAATVGSIIGGNGSAVPVTPTSPGAAPAAPTGLRETANVSTWGTDGAIDTYVALAWNEVTQDAAGNPIDVVRYEVASRIASGLSTTQAAVETTEASFTGLAAGVARFVRVRARSRAGVWSEWSPEVSVTPRIPSSIVPKPPTGLAVASNTGAFAADGAATATVRVAWSAVTQSTDETPVTVGAYRVELEDGQVWIELAETTGREAIFTVPTGKARRVRVRARSEIGVWGDPSAPLSVTGANPTQTTTAASTPVLAAGMGLVTVAWDGKLAGGANPPASFQLLYAETAPAASGPWTRATGSPARGAGQVATIKGAAGSTVFVRLVWLDTLGRVATASTVASIAVTPIGGGDIDKTITDALDKAGRDATAAGQTAEKAVQDALNARDAATTAQTTAEAARDSAIAAARNAENKVVNGTFERGTEGWDISGLTLDLTGGREGTAALMTTGAGSALQAAVIVTAGQRWRLEFWYRTDGTQAGAVLNGGLRLQRWNGTSWTDAGVTTTTVVGDWTRQSVDYVVPDGVTRIRTRLAWSYSGGVRLWFDDVRLYDVTQIVALEVAAQAAQSKAEKAERDAATAQSKADAAASAASAAQGKAEGAASAAAVAQARADAAITNAKTAQDAADAAAARAAALLASAENQVADPSVSGGQWAPTEGWALSNRGRTDTASLVAPGTPGTRTTAVLRAPGGSGGTTVPVEPEQWWEFGGWYLVDEAWDGKPDNSKLRLANQSGALLGAAGIPANTVRETWVRVSLRFRVPANGSVTGLRLNLVSDHTNGFAWWDDLFVRNITAAVKAEADAKAAADAAAAAKTAADAAAATAADALAKAGSAQTTANTALTSASGRNALFHDVTGPSGQGTRVGDIWQQWSSMAVNGRLLATWRWSGSAWVKTLLDETYIPLLNIGAGTYGSLKGDRLVANTVSTKSLVVGDFTNLIEDEDFIAEIGLTWARRSGATSASSFAVTTGLPGKAWKLDGVGTEVSVTTVNDTPVDPGAKYRLKLRAQVQLSGSTPKAYVRAYWFKTDNTASATQFTNVLTLDPAGWSDYSVEVTAPADAAYMRLVLIHGNNCTGGSWWVGRISMRPMATGEMIVDGDITGRHVAARSFTGEHMQLGSLSVDLVEPAFGQNLDLTSNGSISLVTSIQAGLQQGLAQAKDDLAATDERAANAAAAASAARAGLSSAQQQVDAVRDAQAATQASLAQTQAYFRFANAEAIIGRTDSPTTLHLRNTGLEIREQGVPVMWATAQQIHVPSLVTGTVVLGNHQLAREGTGTVMRAL